MWLFQISVSQLRVFDLQIPENTSLDKCTLICRLLFDGKVVNLAVSQVSQIIQEKESVRFRYRLRVSTVEELVVSLSQRTAVFQVLLLNGSWRPTSADANRENEYCIGFAATSLLRLAQSECAHYEFHLMAPTHYDSSSMSCAANGGTSRGRMTVKIFMEQLAEIRLQPIELEGIGLKDGIYGLRCRLFSASSELLSSSTSSNHSFSYGNTSGGAVAVSGTARWNDAALIPSAVVFIGTRRALVMQLLQLTVLQLHRNGTETPIVSFTLRLTELQEQLVDTFLNLPFELRSNEVPITLRGVLQFRDLPVFALKVRQMSTAERKVKSLRDESGKDHSTPMLSLNSLQKPSSESKCNLNQTTKSIVPLESDVLLAKNSLAKLSNQENVYFPQEGSINNNTNSQKQNGDNDISKGKYENPLPSGVDHAMGKDEDLLGTVQEKEDDENMKKPSDAILSTDCCEDTQKNLEPIIPLPPRDKTLILKRLSNIHNAGDGKKHETYRSNNVSTSYTLREIKGMKNDLLRSEEQRIQYELSRTDMHIAILSMSLRDVHASPLITRRAFHLQRNILEQKLEHLNNAEASLLQLTDTIAKRMQFCRKMQCESMEELFRARKQLKAYAMLLLNLEEFVQTELLADEKS
ncbi:uncharacterized protein TM35_000053560 [Trypanosoma theileri]|uniref:Uncharacterized protein n=1 Tax=Trypanosoma theileri TaxID=67003 RepID=A0A1X0P5Q6_9TRYP|nr:uncharacterized protein TM35_000053560 [Trypanosoma theileri]ORC91760.1 hypothetical protein TM35_000053560 [Trypanosoma theileri]